MSGRSCLPLPAGSPSYGLAGPPQLRVGRRSIGAVGQHHPAGGQHKISWRGVERSGLGSALRASAPPRAAKKFTRRTASEAISSRSPPPCRRRSTSCWEAAQVGPGEGFRPVGNPEGGGRGVSWEGEHVQPMSDRVAAGYLRAALQRPPSWTRPEAHRPTPSRVWLAPLSGAVGHVSDQAGAESRITLEAPSDHPGCTLGSGRAGPYGPLHRWCREGGGF